jgi:hypothetical protein
MHDIFICHASEDKEDVARPLAERLRAAGLSVWYDEFALTVGDSLLQSIERGLADSRFGAVILSPVFFAKKWPQAELNGLFAKELVGGKTILPVWHNISHAEVVQHSPILADRKAASTSDGIDKVLEQLLDVVLSGWRHTATRARAIAVMPSEIRLHSGEWSVQTPVTVMNRSDAPAYAVTLNILVSGVGVTASSLKIDGDSQVPALEIALGDVVVSADQLGIDYVDSKDRQAVLFIFHTIPPRGTRTLSIRGTVPVISMAEISVLSLEDTPRGILTKDGDRVAMTVTPPDNITIHATRIMMRRRN